MQALLLPFPGDIQGLQLSAVPDPRPGPSEVVLRVGACGLCHHDLLVAKGGLRRGVKPSLVLGHEIAGEVIEMGAEVRTLKKGDRVATLLTNACGACDRCLTGQEHRCLHGQGIGHSADGGFAEFVKVSGFSAVKVPSGMPFEQACLLGCPIGVAYHALKGIARVQAGETALVTGAGGGLGVHSIQLLRAFGAQVLAATTSPEKVEGLQELGADSVILSPEMDFHWEVLALTQERGVEVVVDTVGSRVSQPCYDSLAQFGRWVLLGEIQGGTMNVNPALLIFKDRRLLASSGASRRDLLDSARLVRTGRVIPKVQAFSLREAKRAFELLEQRRLFGRAVLIP